MSKDFSSEDVDQLATTLSRLGTVSGDQGFHTSNLIRQTIHELPKLFDAAFLNQSPQLLSSSAGKMIRSLTLAVANFDPGDSFAKSPEYWEAVEKYRLRISSASNESSEVELHAR